MVNNLLNKKYLTWGEISRCFYVHYKVWYLNINFYVSEEVHVDPPPNPLGKLNNPFIILQEHKLKNQ